jgi:GT2 family glycosyltransferase
MTIGIAIPCYKNVQRLAQCLESVRKFAPDLLAGAVVVDDSGTSEVRNALLSDYPQVNWKSHHENRGFGRSATEAILASTADIVVLLNDDVQLLSHPAPPLQSLFSNSNLFAATFQSVDLSGHFREGAKRLVWRVGFPKILHNLKNRFDPLFDPFYWEDVDLSARARIKGWNTVYCPDCVVQHDETGAIRVSHQQDEIRRITFRNRLLFARRHCSTRRRPLLKMSIAMQWIQARIKGDRAITRAINEADERWIEFYLSKQAER